MRMELYGPWRYGNRQEWKKERRKEILRSLWGIYRWALPAIALCVVATIGATMVFIAEGDSTGFLVCALMWMTVLGIEIRLSLRLWRAYVAFRLYWEDIADGTCPDLGMQIRRENMWRWYRKQGSPWRISSTRARPDVRFVEARNRLRGMEHFHQNTSRSSSKRNAG